MSCWQPTLPSPGMSSRPGEGRLAGAPAASTQKCSGPVDLLPSVETQGGRGAMENAWAEKRDEWDSSPSAKLQLGVPHVTSVPSFITRD